MRRLLLASAAALAALASSIASAQTTLKVVMHSDVKVLDPIWSGAYITRNHGYMLYDTLFAMDEKFAIK
ncbi:MAG: ABC transporter substrate-binding protein, partial [Alphaproteobacteria bacterium]|nr:ABC transporter substrate-binding protein [Alphaproteobacteria bacterium]